MDKQGFTTSILSREELYLLVTQLVADEYCGKTHCLCHLDIDNFRVVNHGQGLLAGDMLLKEVSELLAGVIGSENKLAWFYGDCFVIYFDSCGINKAKKIIAQIQAELKEFRFKWKKDRLAISVSFGVVQLDEYILVDAESTLLLAEEACKSVKLKGGDGVEALAGSELLNIIKEQRVEAKWVSKIYRAFEDDHFQLYYQPIESLNPALKEKHYEFLIRMIDQDGKLIPPGLFMAAAEKYELGVKIDSWVVKTAFTWMDAYSDLISNDMSWGINLSGQSLANDDFLDLVLEQFERKDIHHAKVYFEITETAAINNIDNAVKFIDAIHSKGGKVALDDFGSGLSSFAYLKNLPVDYIKIDGLFIKNILQDDIDLSLVKAIRDIAISMNKQTIAEFVESEAVKSKLQEIKIDFAQGYIISKPLPLAKYAENEGLAVL